MIIAPIIFCTIVVGIAAMEDMKKVGKTGGYAVLYFEIVSTFALIIGLLVVNIWKLGVGMKVDVATLDTKSVNMLLVMMLTSKGAAAIAGEGFIVIDLAATLASGGAVPVAALALILGIDRFMSEARSLTNFIGNSVATVVVAKWCNALDMKRLANVFNGEAVIEAELAEMSPNADSLPVFASQP